VLDYTDHQVLRDQGHVRRLLAAAASDLGKTLEFRVRDPSERVPSSVVSGRLGAGQGTPSNLRSSGGRGKRLVRSQSSGTFGGGSGVRARRRFSAASSARPVQLLVIFALAAGALLAGVILFILPRARVTLITTAEPLSADLVIAFTAGGVTKSSGTDTYPARHLVVEETIEGEFVVETVVETGERSQGTVALMNRTSTPQGIKSGTRLSSEHGPVMRTERDVIIPPLAKASVKVRAELGGTTGNLSRQRLSMSALPKASQRLLFAEVIEPLRGGTDQPVRTLAEEDIARAAGALKDQAEVRLRRKLQTEFGDQEAWFERGELLRTVVAEETTSVPAGAATEIFRLRAKVRAEMLTAPQGALRDFLRNLLRARVGKAKDIAKDLSLDDLRVLDVRWDELTANLSLHVETTVVPALDQDGIKEQLGGRSVSDAEAFLRNLQGISSASVALSPVWVKHVPENRRNVHIRLERGR